MEIERKGIFKKPLENYFQIQKACRHIKKPDLPLAHFFNDGWERLFLWRKAKLHLVHSPSSSSENSGQLRVSCNYFILQDWHNERLFFRSLCLSVQLLMWDRWPCVAPFHSVLLYKKLLPDSSCDILLLSGGEQLSSFAWVLYNNKFKVLVLSMSITSLCNFILLVNFISERNTVLFIPLHLSDSFNYFSDYNVSSPFCPVKTLPVKFPDNLKDLIFLYVLRKSPAS